MTAGVEIRRDSGSLILTTNLKNPIIVAQGSVSTGATTLQDGAGSIATVPASGKLRTIRTANNWHRLDATKFWIDAASGTSVDYFNWDFPTDVYTDVGLEMYTDAPGEHIVFSTNPTHKPMRAKYVRPDRPNVVFYAENNVLNTDFVPTAGRSYAMTHGVWSGKHQWDNFAQNPSTGFDDEQYWGKRVYCTQIKLTSSGIEYGYHCINPPIGDFIGTGPSVGPPAGNTKENGLMLFVCDVTGY